MKDWDDHLPEDYTTVLAAIDVCDQHIARDTAYDRLGEPSSAPEVTVAIRDLLVVLSDSFRSKLDASPVVDAVVSAARWNIEGWQPAVRLARALTGIREPVEAREPKPEEPTDGARKMPSHPQPPLTEREAYWSTVGCRDLTGTHRFGVWAPGQIGARRCDGCDRTAAMLDGGLR